MNDANCGIGKKAPGWTAFTGPNSPVGGCYRGFGAAKVSKMAKIARPARVVPASWTLEPDEKKRRPTKPERL